MQAARSQIDSRFTALRGVESQNPHPNEAWSTKIVDNTKRTKRDTFATWDAFWQGQAALRQWPAVLGDDFVQRAAALKPGGTLSRKLLERYQDGVRQLVRELPRRMGSDDHMRDESIDAAAAGPAAAAPQVSRALVAWSPDDQRRIYQSFNWQNPPSTTQVVLAQEELWVYGLFCDSIARLNRSAAGAYNAPIPRVDHMAVGYAAAEEVPGGGGTITAPQPVAGAAAAPAATPAAPLPRPPHPRFGSSPVAAPDDDALKNWIYVDFDGKPLMAADLATNPAAQMVHLMPFVLLLTMDQRSLDSLLVDLASSPIPIDVRQVRINAPWSVTGSGFVAPSGPPPSETGPSGRDRPRLHDIRVEIRGTVGLATPPSPQAIGIDEADLQLPGENQEQPEAAAEKAPPAAAPVPEEPAS
jgi:hypothetical protein